VRRLALPGALAVVSALAGCGSGAEPALTVFAASSLQEPLGAYGKSFGGAEVRTSFAGSDTLAAQIRQGAGPDVFAAADTGDPAELHREGLVGKPVVFAANELVIAVPTGSAVASIEDLTRPGTSIVIGDPSVPVGSYTREALAHLPTSRRAAILANVRSEEPEVSSVVAKLVGGAADAGFVYVTDVEATGGELKAVPLPPGLQPEIAYAAAVVSGSGERQLAQRYLDGLLEGKGETELHRAGFLPPP
jgi:molybdate transport system substrate-binding protein